MGVTDPAATAQWKVSGGLAQKVEFAIGPSSTSGSRAEQIEPHKVGSDPLDESSGGSGDPLNPRTRLADEVKEGSTVFLALGLEGCLAGRLAGL